MEVLFGSVRNHHYKMSLVACTKMRGGDQLWRQTQTHVFELPLKAQGWRWISPWRREEKRWINIILPTPSGLAMVKVSWGPKMGLPSWSLYLGGPLGRWQMVVSLGGPHGLASCATLGHAPSPFLVEQPRARMLRTPLGPSCLSKFDGYSWWWDKCYCLLLNSSPRYWRWFLSQGGWCYMKQLEWSKMKYSI